MAEKKEFTFEVKNNIGKISEGRSGWAREVNFVSWNGAKAKLDIRDWSEDHSKMGKGISLSYDELITLRALIEDIDESYFE